MFLPLHDKNPLKIVTFQFVSVAFIILCCVVFIWQITLTQQAQSYAVYAYGMVPSVLLNGVLLPTDVAKIPAQLTLVSYMFLHGDWLHLLGNMLFLWVFGDNIEDSMGHIRFFFFFLFCGMAAGLVHGFFNPGSEVPLIGASGAIAGILGAYLVLHPKVKVLVLVFSRIPIRLPAYLLLLAWIAFQFYSQSQNEGQDVVSWWAHIAGFMCGVLLIIPMRYKRVPLFDQGVEH